MKNNFTERDVGHRIQKTRKEIRIEGKRLSLEDVGKACNRTRQLVAKWERGDLTSLEFNDLDAMCDLFQCDIGYLLGEFDTKRHTTADIQEETGLSAKAIEKIADMNRYSAIPIEILSMILEHPEIQTLLHKIYELAWNESAHEQLKNLEKRSKMQGDIAQGVRADIAKQNVEETKDSKEFKVTKVFGNILDEIVGKLVKENTGIHEMGARMMQQELYPEEKKRQKQAIFEMITKTYLQEDQQNG